MAVRGRPLSRWSDLASFHPLLEPLLKPLSFALWNNNYFKYFSQNMKKNKYEKFGDKKRLEKNVSVL